jgi:hypothetical protein
MHRFAKRPSAALVISLIALFVAVGGSAYAVTTLGKNTVGSKQIKKHSIKAVDVKKNTLTGKEINESKLGQVPSAKTADSATTATTAVSANPVAFAEILGDSTVVDANSKGVTQANVTKPAATTGTYCVSGLALAVRGGQVTPVFGGSTGVSATFTLGATGNCPNGGQVILTDAAGAQQNNRFLIMLYG